MWTSQGHACLMGLVVLIHSLLQWNPKMLHFLSIPAKKELKSFCSFWWCLNSTGNERNTGLWIRYGATLQCQSELPASSRKPLWIPDHCIKHQWSFHTQSCSEDSRPANRTHSLWPLVQITVHGRASRELHTPGWWRVSASSYWLLSHQLYQALKGWSFCWNEQANKCRLPFKESAKFGDVAQFVECLPSMREVMGSIPSTT